MNFKEDARPLSVVFLVLGLIVAAALEAVGYPPPDWFIPFAFAYIGEWSVERAVRKRKGV